MIHESLLFIKAPCSKPKSYKCQGGMKRVYIHYLFRRALDSSSVWSSKSYVSTQTGAAAVPALRQAPATHVRHVEEDFAPTALDQVPTGHKIGAEPVVQ